jgi:hypothetical protein
MPQTPDFNPTGTAADLEVGTRVRHIGRLDVGEGNVTFIHADGRCDVEFDGCSFSGIPISCICSVDELWRQQVLQEQALAQRRQMEQERAQQEREQARARQELRERKAAAQRQLFRKVRAGQRLSDEEVALLRTLPAREQLELFASVNTLGPVLDELLRLLQQVSADDNLRDAVRAFWKARLPSPECTQLMPLAPAWWKERQWRALRYARLPLPEKLKILSRDALQLSSELRRELVEELLQDHAAKELFDLASSQASVRLRLELLVSADSSLIQRFEDMAVQALLDASAAESKAIIADLVGDFWRKHELSVKRRSRLFNLAPERIKRGIVQRYFKPHLVRLESLFDHNSSASGDWPASVVYSELDDQDNELADLWSSGASAAHETARMLSARAAEKVARWFYTHLGCDTTDVALHQLTGESAAWKTHDLLLNGQLPLDVKNARLPLNNRAFYVEHTVPRFKRDRSGRGVTIVAVCSPYLKLTYLKDPDSAPFEVSDVRYLGEATLDTIRGICTSFTGSALTVQDPAEGAFVPPWYFDFPNAWYREFDRNCVQLRNSELPDEYETRLLHDVEGRDFPIPEYIAARLMLPTWQLDAMPAWMRMLVSELEAACRPRPKLAHIFMLLLTDFLRKLRLQNIESYEPSDYLKVLFHVDGSAESRSRQRPLGIEDPLRTIRTLCESLQQLWDAREHLNLERFSEYRLSGGGILQGRGPRGQPWETVLSYCGGRIEGKGKCGCAPLILGVESQCSTCRKLVCRQCGYCSEKCRAGTNGSESEDWSEFS